jgi:Response regulator containing CheY-like receiver, AAA-type ATPase, and DNA-binding domains
MSTLSPILVVEDQALLLLDLIDQLAEFNYEALPAQSARTAARLIESGIRALITDIELGDGPNGLVLARLAARLRPGLPIVVVSGGVRPAKQDLPPGAAFLPKPYRVDAIVAALERQEALRAA